MCLPAIIYGANVYQQEVDKDVGTAHISNAMTMSLPTSFSIDVGTLSVESQGT